MRLSSASTVIPRYSDFCPLGRAQLEDRPSKDSDIVGWPRPRRPPPRFHRSCRRLRLGQRPRFPLRPRRLRPRRSRLLTRRRHPERRDLPDFQHRDARPSRRLRPRHRLQQLRPKHSPRRTISRGVRAHGRVPGCSTTSASPSPADSEQKEDGERSGGPVQLSHGLSDARNRVRIPHGRSTVERPRRNSPSRLAPPRGEGGTPGPTSPDVTQPGGVCPSGDPAERNKRGSVCTELRLAVCLASRQNAKQALATGTGAGDKNPGIPVRKS